MTKFSDLHNEWMKDPEYKREYDALDQEFMIIEAIVSAKAAAGIDSEQLAKRMNTTQATIARFEHGKQMPSTRTLEKLAKATGTKLRISFEVVG